MAWLLRSGSWSWEPSVLIGLSLVAGGYAVLVSPLRRRLDWGGPVPFGRQLCFYLGTVSVFVALVSPLDILADEFLFSAHMAQHMLLTFVAAPLWLIGLPGWVPEQLASRARLVWAGTRLTQPAVAFVVFNGA
ncbi:MAG TPA: cytochrome c oxidase assembly protein, partial [Anaerolineales bacterium]|nr:cytochrome c oxidase assembly protein [Anaerolineales bacterium]